MLKRIKEMLKRAKNPVEAVNQNQNFKNKINSFTKQFKMLEDY